MDVLLEILAAPVVLVGVIVDWVYSVVIIAGNFFVWLFSVVGWLIDVVSALFVALFNPVQVTASEIRELVGDNITGNSIEKVLEVVTFMYSKVPDAVWVAIMSLIGVSLVWRAFVSEKEKSD